LNESISFWKIHGLGNDYILIDNREEKFCDDDLGKIVQNLCKRRFSIGADGLILLQNSILADIKMRIFNADGSEAEMCGNGIRCLAKYCYEKKVVNKNKIEVDTKAGIKSVWLNIEDEKVTSSTVDMGIPILERDQIPILGNGKCINENFEIDGESYKITCLSIGNPHCIIFVDNVKDFPVEILGPKIEKHPFFPKRVNVEFVQVLSRNELYLRTWERGVGETLACGTGACASVVAGNILGKIANLCTVHLLGGDLIIEYTDKRISMTGPAEKSFEGYVNLSSIRKR
jgi:diaminopimelate epimerase